MAGARVEAGSVGACAIAATPARRGDVRFIRHSDGRRDRVRCCQSETLGYRVDTIGLRGIQMFDTCQTSGVRAMYRSDVRGQKCCKPSTVFGERGYSAERPTSKSFVEESVGVTSVQPISLEVRMSAATTQKIEPSETIPKILTISAAKGGVSKSSTCRNLAVVAARTGLAVALVDVDLQRTLSDWYDIRLKRIAENPDEGLADITLFSIRMSEVDEIPNLRGFDVVIVDMPPLVVSGESEDDRRLAHLSTMISYSDYVLVPSGQQVEDLTSAQTWMDFLRGKSIKFECLLTATNRRTKSFESAKHRLGQPGAYDDPPNPRRPPYPQIPFDIPRLEDIPLSHQCGLGVSEIKRGKGAEDYAAVWNHVRNQIGL